MIIKQYQVLFVAARVLAIFKYPLRLRISCSLAENERFGGVSQMCPPHFYYRNRKFANKIFNALPTICTERNLYEFESIYHLMQYIQVLEKVKD